MVRRLPAAELEAAVIGAVRNHVKPAAQIEDRSLIEAHIARVEVKPEYLVIQLTQPQQDVADDARGRQTTLQVPWCKGPPTRRREILLPAAARHDVRPMRAETRATLLTAIAHGRRWLHELVSDRPIDRAARGVQRASGDDADLARLSGA